MDDKPIRLLIADDHALFRDGIRALLLATPDITCVGEAASGDEIVALVEEVQSDVILMDINMPDMDGYTLTAKIKKMQGFEQTPILALAANVMRGDKEKVLEAGCDGYIQKPIDFDELVQEVEKFIMRSANA